MNYKLDYIEEELFSIGEDVKKIQDVHAIVQERVFVGHGVVKDMGTRLSHGELIALFCEVRQCENLSNVVEDYTNKVMKDIHTLRGNVNNMRIEDKIFAKLTENNISLPELAEKMGMDKDDLYVKIGDYQSFTVSECRKLADVLKIDKPEIFFYPLIKEEVNA